MKKSVNSEPETTFQQIIFQDKTIVSSLIFSCMLVLYQWILLAIYGWQLPDEIPMYNSLPVGEDQLAGKLFLMILPSASLLFFISELLILRFLPSQLAIYRHIISWTTTLLIFLLSIALTHKILLVI